MFWKMKHNSLKSQTLHIRGIIPLYLSWLSCFNVLWKQAIFLSCDNVQQTVGRMMCEKKNCKSDPRSSMKETHENTLRILTSKSTCQPFSIMIFNSFSLILQHTYLCQFQSYLFLNPKNTHFVKSNPWGFTVSWHTVLPKYCYLRITFHRWNCVAFQGQWYNCWPVVLTTTITRTQLIYARSIGLQATQTAMTHLGVIWN